MKRERYAGWIILMAIVAMGCWANTRTSDLAQMLRNVRQKVPTRPP